MTQNIWPEARAIHTRRVTLHNKLIIPSTSIIVAAAAGLLWWTQVVQPERALANARAATVTIHVLVAEASHDPDSNGKPVLYRATNGSGFFIDSRGYIVTNAHVVQSAVRIEVELADGSRRAGTMVGADRLSDIAVVRIGGAIPATVRFAQAEPKLGDAVFAIGSPYGLTGSLSTGLVSGLERALRPSAANWLVQHTALIDPGSSGGPVFNTAGDVIGVNSAFPDSQFEFSGISFAVQADVASRIAREIIATGQVRRAEIGATFRAIDGLMAISAGLSDQMAVLVSAVEADSPAARAGLAPGDKLLALNGQTFAGLSALVRSIALADISRPLAMTVETGTKSRIVTLTPRVSVIAPGAPEIIGEDSGLTLSNKDPVLVVTVRPFSRAAAAGIEPGDLIGSINLRAVQNSAQANQLLAASGPFVTLGVTRPGSPQRLVVLGSEASAHVNIASNDRGVSNADL